MNQSTLTGESDPVRKTHDAVLREGLGRSEVPNLVFAGTSVASGTAKAAVVATGMQTEFSKIAKLTQTLKEEKSPLQKELDRVTRQVSAMAVQRMVKEHALVKRLSAVETLGCTSVICSDKAGTLTQNEMTVCNLWLPNREHDVTGLGYAPKGKVLRRKDECSVSTDGDLNMLLTAAALCSNARVVTPEPVFCTKRASARRTAS